MNMDSSFLNVRSSRIHRKGVFTVTHFSQGDLIKTLDDSRVVDPDHPLNSKLDEYEHHCDWLAGGKQILMPTPERFINHSCEPNTYVRTENELRHVIALREIQAGEEITYDYLLNCHGGVMWKCNCGKLNCRKNIPSSFFDLSIEEQKEKKHLLDSWFVREHYLKLQNL